MEDALLNIYRINQGNNDPSTVDLIETLSLKIHNGVRFSYIFPRDVVIPKGRRQLLLKFGWRDLISKGLVERRGCLTTSR